MKVGVLGSGDVAQALAAGFLKHGHGVMLGTRDAGKLAKFAKAHPKARLGSVSEAAAFGSVAVLAVRGDAAADVVRSAGPEHLAGKAVLDATNPISEAPPVDGVIGLFTGPGESLLERLQGAFPDVRFVKAFNSVGSASMVDPKFKGGKPTMFICGNDAAAKKTATAILDEFGWETADMGKAIAARAIEPLAVLWCIPGFLRNDWVHAFKLLR